MKISEITIEDVKNYVNVFHNEDDNLFTAILVAAKTFVSSYTGLSAENLDVSEDLSMAVFVLSSELYDNRAYNVDAVKINPVIETILSMHSINLL